MLKKLKLKKIIKKASFSFKKLPRFLAENAFIVSLIFIFFALILGALVFYKYSFLVEKREPEVLEEPALINERAFQEILKIWQEREKRFQETELKIYPDPFRID